MPYGQDDGRRRIRQQGRKNDEEYQAGRHQSPLVQPFFGNVQHAVLPKDVTGRRKDVDGHGKDNDDPQGFQRFKNEPHRQPGNGKIQGHKSRDDTVGLQGICQKDGDDENHYGDDFYPRIEAVQERRPRKILPQCDISEHGPSLLSSSRK